MTELATLTGGFIIGVFLRSVFEFGWPVIVFVLVLAALCAVPHFFNGRRALALGAAFFLLCALGMLRMSLADTPLPSAFASDLKHRVTYEGVVASDPSLTDTAARVPVRVRKGSITTIVLASVGRDQAPGVGDTVSVTGSLELPQPFATDGGRTFRYDKFLQKDGVRFVLSYATVDVLKRAPWYSLPAALAGVKHFFMRGIDAALPEPFASLAAGVTIGGKVGLGADLLQAFVFSGLVQIIVLSGYNVMVVAESVMVFFAALGISRKWSAVLGALALVLFVGVAGASSTALRAMLMALIALYARAAARSYAASRALLAIIFLMLIYNPLTLVFDPGFDLSVAATAGLIWLSPLIELKLVRIKNAFWRVALATTLAAQFAVLPLLLYETGRFSIYSIPANLLVLPIVPLTMALALLAGIAGAVLGAASLVTSVLALPAYAALAYIIWIAREASALPLASSIVPAFPFVLVVLAYLALYCIAFAKRSSTTVQLMLSKKASM